MAAKARIKRWSIMSRNSRRSARSGASAREAIQRTCPTGSADHCQSRKRLFYIANMENLPDRLQVGKALRFEGGKGDTGAFVPLAKVKRPPPDSREAPVAGGS